MTEVRFERMRPGELESLVRERPLAWLPVGTLEWHGRHLPVGLDALKAHELCVRFARRVGGAVLPPNYFSILGMMFPWTFKYPPSVLGGTVAGTLRGLHKYGFKVMIIVTGHYPQAQVLYLMAVAEAFMAAGGAVAVALPEFAKARETGYNGDHAAKWETSLMMELFPELVDAGEMERLRGARFFSLFRAGIHGINPCEAASREAGAAAVEEMTEGFACLADNLLESGDKEDARREHRRFIGRYMRTEASRLADSLRRTWNENGV